MGKLKTNKSTKPKRLKQVKGKKWRKGHMSTSNPENSAFREAARNRFFGKSTGPSNLTMDALAKHDETHNDVDMGKMSTDDADRRSMGTLKTWATNWTECTNTTFTQVNRLWSSNSALHREIVAVLAAVSDVIKVDGSSGTDTEYFAALMTALESSEGVESLSAIAILLAMVVKNVPTAVLRSRFAEVARCIMDLLGKYTDGESTSLIKSLVTILSHLLQAQEQAVWRDSSVQQVYKGLLTFVTHKKPKVRKVADQGVCTILKDSSFMSAADAPAHHPAAAMTTKHCIQIVEATGGMGEAIDTLHCLSLVKRILPVLPEASVKSVCETLLRVMTLSNVMVTANSMQAFHSLFQSKPSAKTLTTQLNGQIISALYDFQPSPNDLQPVLAWLAVMEAAHSNLIRLDEQLGLSHLPRLFSECLVCVLSDKPQIAQGATKCMKGLMEKCITSRLDVIKKVVGGATKGAPSPVHKIVTALESGLSYHFHASWGLVLQVFAVTFQTLGKTCPELFKKSLTSIAELRETVRFAYKAELDGAVGCAVKAMGPRTVLQAIPLQITGQSDDLDFPRSWLLPVLRENVSETELDFFTSYFLPLAAKLRERALELSDQQNVAAAKSYEALQHQIWSLLPGFCTKPTDLVKSFKGVAKVLGTAIGERSDLRLDVMSSLRKLIKDSEESESDEARTELSRFSKNFLPILFNLYTAETIEEKDPARDAVLLTVKSYFSISDSKLMNTFCDNCLLKLKECDVSLKPKETEVSSFKRFALYDLVIAMIPYLEKSHLELIVKLATDHLQVLDKTLQKKSYRILETLCAGHSKKSREYVLENLPAIQTLLVQSLSSSSPSSKAPRLKCLISIFRCLDESQEEFLLACVPEAILCTKEVAQKARGASYVLLVEMGRAALRWSGKDNIAGLEQYFKMVMAGFAASPQMISCTLLALTRIVFEFKARLSEQLLNSVLESVCLLLRSPSREVVRSSLTFTKVVLAAFPTDVLAPHLKSVMSSLTSLKEDCHHHFRFKTKDIYSKLIRKFGYETIHGMSTDSIRKVLTNIRKTERRAQEKKNSPKEEEDDDDTAMLMAQTENIDELLKDSDDEDDDKKKKKPASKADKSAAKAGKGGKKAESAAGKAWLQEGAAGAEIMDFMDSTASKKVMATKPQDKKAKKDGSIFKTGADGRIIMNESSDEEGGDTDEENIDELLEALEKGRDTGKIKQKKQKRKLEDLGDSGDEGAGPSKYQAGGKGIHRPLQGNTEKPSRAPAGYGNEYKAKSGQGDVKKKGKPEPYAYVPLDFRSLNKRKQAKVKGQFSNLVKGAQKGASKGKKGKMKMKK